MSKEVFISYSQEDRAPADALCEGLEARGIDCWIAPRDIVPGHSWAAAIVEAIDTASFLVLVFSSRSNKSPHVIRELERAANKRITIVPFRIEATEPVREVSYFISSSQWLDATMPPLQLHIDELAGILQKGAIGRQQGGADNAAATWPGATQPGAAGDPLAGRYGGAASSPRNLLVAIQRAMDAGESWSRIIDCRDEVLLHDLRSVLRKALTKQGFIEASVIPVEVGLMELCRNVARHATVPLATVELQVNVDLARCVLSVVSEGPVFTLQEGLAKYRDTPTDARIIHGLGNLLFKGDVVIGRSAQSNLAQFSCLLTRKKVKETAQVNLSLDEYSITLGEARYTYHQWVRMLVNDVTYSEETPLVHLEQAKLKLIEAWGRRGVVPVRVTEERPTWTMLPLEGRACDAFDELVESIAADRRFVVLDHVTASGQANQGRLTMLREKLRKWFP